MWCWPICISQLCGGSCEEGQTGEGTESTLCWSAWCLPTKRYELPRERLCQCEWTQHALLISIVPFAGQESDKEIFLPADILIFWLMRDLFIYFSPSTDNGGFCSYVINLLGIIAGGTLVFHRSDYWQIGHEG